MTRQELDGMAYAEVKTKLEAEMVTFSEEISNLSKEELEARETEIVNELNEYDKYLDGVEYKLPSKCEFNGTPYTRNAIAKLIIYFLDKIEVEWSYTLGMYQLTQLWRSKDLKTIKYKAYDSTLRCLDGVKFKGSSDWRDILAINEYMSKCHNLYSIDTAWLYFLSGKHNAILDLLNKDKQPQPEQSQPEV